MTALTETQTRPGSRARPGTIPSPSGDIAEAASAGTRADAAEELFKAAYPRLAGWVNRHVDDDDIAHEIASEAFVWLLSRWTRVESPQSYLYMVATNLIRDHWRKAERERRALRSMAAGRRAPSSTTCSRPVPS
jgi:RNA polymerase sigma-70 factor, ECF subfamily